MLGKVSGLGRITVCIHTIICVSHLLHTSLLIYIAVCLRFTLKHSISLFILLLFINNILRNIQKSPKAVRCQVCADLTRVSSQCAIISQNPITMCNFIEVRLGLHQYDVSMC